MNKEKAKTIEYYLLKEIQRYSMTEWCEEIGVTCDEVKDFLAKAVDFYDDQDKKQEDENE